MPQVRSVSADRVRRVSLLQRHEKIWGTWQDETVLHYEAVYRSKSTCCYSSFGGFFPMSVSPGDKVWD